MRKQTKQKIAVPTPEDELQEKSNQIWMMQGQIQKLQKDLDDAQADARGRISFKNDIEAIAEELFGREIQNSYTRAPDQGVHITRGSKISIGTHIIARIRELQTKLELSERNAIGLQARLDLISGIHINEPEITIEEKHE
jgi:hypothetical protein